MGKSFGRHLKNYSKITDSQVALFWINSTDKPLKPWVRSRVIEINRLSEISRWYYIQSKNNIADIGTRKGVQVKKIEQNSAWINGYPWMTASEEDFPTMTIQNFPLKKIEDDVNAEMLKYGQILADMELMYAERDSKNDIPRI